MGLKDKHQQSKALTRHRNRATDVGLHPPRGKMNCMRHCQFEYHWYVYEVRAVNWGYSTMALEKNERLNRQVAEVKCRQSSTRADFESRDPFWVRLTTTPSHSRRLWLAVASPSNNNIHLDQHAQKDWGSPARHIQRLILQEQSDWNDLHQEQW